MKAIHCWTVVVATCLHVISAPIRGEDTMSAMSWNQLQERLTKLLDEDGRLLFTALRDADDLREITSPDGAALWWEMLAQWDTPIVVIAGYECIAAHCERGRFGAALNVLGSKPPEIPIDLLTKAVIDVGDVTVSADSIAALTDFARRSTAYPAASVIFSVALLPKAFLEQWWSAKTRSAVPASFEAVVLGKLISESKDPNQRSAYQARLRRLSVIPGRARAIYVAHGSDTDGDLPAKLKNVLEDASIDNVTILVCVRRHQKAVRELIRTGELHMDKQRSDLVGEILEYPSNRGE